MSQQLTLPMLTVYEGPRLVSPSVVASVTSYRDAVRMCWQLRTRPALTRAALAEESGVYASHVTDYLSHGESKRELPAKHIEAFERACGNRVISQYQVSRAGLTIMESFIPAYQVAA